MIRVILILIATVVAIFAMLVRPRGEPYTDVTFTAHAPQASLVFNTQPSELVQSHLPEFASAFYKELEGIPDFEPIACEQAAGSVSAWQLKQADLQAPGSWLREAQKNQQDYLLVLLLNLPEAELTAALDKNEHLIRQSLVRQPTWTTQDDAQQWVVLDDGSHRWLITGSKQWVKDAIKRAFDESDPWEQYMTNRVYDASADLDYTGHHYVAFRTDERASRGSGPLQTFLKNTDAIAFGMHTTGHGTSCIEAIAVMKFETMAQKAEKELSARLDQVQPWLQQQACLPDFPVLSREDDRITLKAEFTPENAGRLIRQWLQPKP